MFGFRIYQQENSNRSSKERLPVVFCNSFYSSKNLFYRMTELNEYHDYRESLDDDMPWKYVLP